MCTCVVRVRVACDALKTCTTCTHTTRERPHETHTHTHTHTHTSSRFAGLGAASHVAARRLHVELRVVQHVGAGRGGRARRTGSDQFPWLLAPRMLAPLPVIPHSRHGAVLHQTLLTEGDRGALSQGRVHTGCHAWRWRYGMQKKSVQCEPPLTGVGRG